MPPVSALTIDHSPPPAPRLLQVQALRDDPRYAKLHELVSIFSHQSLGECVSAPRATPAFLSHCTCDCADAYLAFYAAHSGYVESLGMDHAQGTETMRLLTLCSLAAASPVLSYDAVAKALQVGVLEREREEGACVQGARGARDKTFC